MPSSDVQPSDAALQLRADALQICRSAAWLPQCIGSGQFDAGVPEIYAELRALQKVRAVYVSQALIACCRRHRLWTPLFEDVEARIWLFLGDRARAQARWADLLHHADSNLRGMAKKALAALQAKAESGVQLATEVAQAQDRNETDRLVTMLLAALLTDEPPDALEDVLEAAALQWPMPEGMPWDRGLFTQQLVLDLFERQLQQWEVEHGG